MAGERSETHSGRFTRRAVLRGGAAAAGGLGLSLFGSAALVRPARADGADDFGPLQPADANGLQLPVGFTSRVVATTGVTVAGTGYTWHANPDGGAVFPTGGGGWIYVSNDETGGGGGGVSALVFDRYANIVDAYQILSGTSRNCAGGATPWGTWLSCEEVPGGLVWECDPTAPGQGVARPALGAFNHEAAAVDPVHETIYLTEDTPTGKLYRFTPSSYPDLSSGTLEVAQIAGGTIAPGQTKDLSWTSTVAFGTVFNGGEGCWYEGGLVYFVTKGDGRVWKLDTNVDPHTIEIYYNGGGALGSPDNVFAASNGDVYVAEDGNNLEIVALTPSGGVHPIVRLTGVSGTEMTGPALTPRGDRLYFSSQRNPGRTYEVTGPFLPAVPVPAAGPLAAGLLAGTFAAAAFWKLHERRTRCEPADAAVMDD